MATRAKPQKKYKKYNKQTQTKQYYKKKAKYQKKKNYGGRYRNADGSTIGRTLLEGGGEMLGSLFGMGTLGKAAGNTLANIVGLGDYEINKNIFLNGRLPAMTNISAGGGTLIRFQEYLGDIITSLTPGLFNQQTFVINPGLENSYPFLSQIAANYEQYSIEGMVYAFKSTSADALNSVNTALGSVMMATQYDVSDPLFSSKAEMLNYEFSSSCKPSENMVHMIECAPRQNVLTELFVRFGTVPTGDDPRMYDLGRLSVATVGFQGASVNIGELYVSYQVRLLKPKLVAALGLPINFWQMQCADHTAANPLGTNRVFAPQNNITISFATPTIIAWPQNYVVNTYLVKYGINGYATPANITWPVITGTNGTVSSLTTFPNNGSSCVGGEMWFYFKTAAGGSYPHIQFGAAGTFPTAGSPNLILSIMQISNVIS